MASYGWNVFPVADGHDCDQILDILNVIGNWDPTDRRPMIVMGKTTKGYWPGAVNGKLPGVDQIVGYRFKRPWRDGTTQVLFHPLALLGKLAALVPFPKHIWLVTQCSSRMVCGHFR